MQGLYLNLNNLIVFGVNKNDFKKLLKYTTSKSDKCFT